MKSFKTLAALFVLLAAFTSLHADDKIKIKIKQPPPNMLGVGDLWNLELTNTTKSDLKIYLTGTATEEKDGLIIEGKSKVFSIKPGRNTYKYNDFSGAEVKYNNGKYKEIILRTGNAPVGSYTMCVTAFDESGTEVGRENCIMQTIQQLGSITLIAPEDNIELDPDTLPGLMFSWTPLPKGGPYSLRIVELKGDQSPEVALKQNRTLLEVNDIKTTSHQVAPSQVKVIMMGMKCAWQVSSGDVVSEPFVIYIPWTTPEISLISPSNGSEIDPDTLPGLTFSWKECPKCPPMYTLRIVEVKGDQSPEEAFRSNQPIFEKEKITTNSFQIDKELDKMQPGTKYAWQVISGNEESDISTITIKMKRPPLNQLKLISPTNGEEIDPDTLPGLMFSWERNDPCPPHVICNYTLRIVELKGNESPETAMKENNPIFEQKGITMQSFQYPLTGPKFEAGKKYAWHIISGDVVSEVSMMLMLSMQNNKK
jgi:hypothetical protein